MSDLVAVILAIVALGLTTSIAALVVYVRRLRLSIECLCSNLGGLRQQIGNGEHRHA